MSTFAGIYGIASEDQRAATSVAASDHTMTTLAGGKIGLGMRSPVVSALPTVVTTRSGSHAVAVFGNLYFGDHGALSSRTIDRFVDEFVHDSERTLRDCDGAFAIAIASNSGHLWLATDHFGTFALHIRKQGTSLLFGSRLQAVAMESAQPDEAGVLTSLALGMTLNGRTCYRDISRLANATILHRSPDGSISVRKYYRPDYTTKSKDIPTTLEKIRQTLTVGLAARLSGNRPMAALTGGLDSRATWAMILGGNAPRPIAHTHGLPNAHDLAVARRIASAMQLNHDIFQVHSEHFDEVPALWQKTAQLGEGSVSVALCFLLPMYEHLQGLTPSAFLDSYGGAFYRRQRMRIAERRIRRDGDLISQILTFELSALATSDLLNTETRQAASSAAYDDLANYYASIEHVRELGDKLDLYHFEQVDAMRDSMLTNLEMNFRAVQHPLMNHRAIDLAATLPVSVRRSDMVPRYIIRHSYPSLERFTLDNVGFPSPYTSWEFTRYAPIVLERAISKLPPPFISLLKPLLLRRPTFDVASQLRPGFDFLRSRLLDTNSVTTPFVDRARLVRSLDRSKDGNYSDANALLQLLTLDLSLRPQ